MDVKIYPNNFNAFITAEKVVDENNQQLSNYVCNVTYTNLKDGQITEIGQQFAKHLSDTDENGNSKAGLHKVALTGDYTQLENKPSASNLQGFHEVAFSGNYNDLNPATRPALTNWPNTKPAFHEVAFNGDYTKLSNTPNLNVSDNNSSITGLADVAISGNYGDLNNLPNLFNFEIIDLDNDYPEVNLNTSTTMELANNNCTTMIYQIIRNGQLPILKQSFNYYLINNYSIKDDMYFSANFINITDTFNDAIVNHPDNIINYVKIHKFFIHIFYYDIFNNKSYLKNSQILNDYVTQYDYDITIGEIWDAITALQSSN